MTFDGLLAGECIFIDANIFTYHFNGISIECQQFIERCSRKEITGFTSTSVPAEVLHRLMIAEAFRKELINLKNPVQQLKNHPEIVKLLVDYQRDVAKIWEMNIRVLTLTRRCFQLSESIRQAVGLLTNDSLILAVMKQVNLSKLATNDNDFGKISWLEVYQPADIR